MHIFIYRYLHIWIGEGNGTTLQYSCLENPMDGGARKAGVHGVAEGRTRLSDFPFTFHFHALEKEMAAHSSTLAWKIPWMEEPGRLESMGSHRVGHDWSDLAAAAHIWIFYKHTHKMYTQTHCLWAPLQNLKPLVGLLREENFTFKNKECYLSGNYITQVTDSLREVFL